MTRIVLPTQKIWTEALEQANLNLVNAMSSDASIRKSCQSSDASVRARGVTDLVERARHITIRAFPLLVAAVHDLERVQDWQAVLTVTDATLHLSLGDSDIAEWIARKAWCLFWLDRPVESWDVLGNFRDVTERCGNLSTRLRIYLVSGYVMDVRGAHARAFAWYTKALAIADDPSRAHVLLEIAKSHSKQGQLADAIARFDEALRFIEQGVEKHQRLAIHLLSRSAVAFENLGDFDEAVRRQNEALVRARSIHSNELEFSCLSRRARTLIAIHDHEGAYQDLTEAEKIAPEVRRGALHIEHDWARFERARGRWRDALERYLGCIRQLPASPQVIAAYSDIWGEILDGLEECLTRTDGVGLDQVRTARTDIVAARERSDIYSGQALTIQECGDRAAASANRLRTLLTKDASSAFQSAGLRFDLGTGIVTGIDDVKMTIRLTRNELILLEFLHTSPDRTAKVSHILARYKNVAGHHFSPDALRKVVARLRERLGLNRNQLFKGMTGMTGGGYGLLEDD